MSPFNKPDEVMTAEKAYAIADFCLKAPDPELAIAEAIVNAWHDGAKWGADESVVLATKLINERVDGITRALRT